MKALSEPLDPIAGCELVQASKMESIGTLASGIAHDFNNILAAIIGYAELAMSEVSELSLAKEDLEEVLKAGYRAKDLVKQILNFSRKSDGECSPVTLGTVIKESLKMLRSVIPANVHICQNIIDTGTVMVDPTHIHQVLMNICTNAVHAMGEAGGVLTIDLENEDITGNNASDQNLPAGRYSRLSISDTGQGMIPEVLDRIFDPYFTTKEPGCGTGLGLTVVQGIVKNFRGAVCCESEPGKGSSFHVYFPRVETVDGSVEIMEERPLPGGNERILFVDDEPALAKMAERILKSQGYSVVSRTSSRDALEDFRKEPYGFDLVITDMTMPVMTGDRLAQSLMEIRRDIPVILCTGFSEHITEEKAKKIGIREFILKPLKKRELAHAIRKILDGERP